MSFLSALLLLIGANGSAPFPTQAGECGWVHGRFSIYNGSSIQRIWVIGTTHMLALYDSDQFYPRSMQRLIDNGRFQPFKNRIYGDYMVCARERWIPGHMQHVRITHAKSLIVR